MKSIYKMLSIGCCMALALSACDDNTWNDDYLDGFDPDAAITDVQNVAYTLQPTDYKSIASNATNVALAEAAGVEAELAAVATQQYLTDVITPQDYIPAFLSSNKSPYFTLTDGSSMLVTYQLSEGAPAELTALANAKACTLGTAEYQAAWGSDENYISGFAPSQNPASYIASYLASTYPDAAKGDYAIVNYATSSQEPIFTTISGGGGDTPDLPIAEGTYYIVADGLAAVTVAADKSYGYLNTLPYSSGAVEGDTEGTAKFTFKWEKTAYTIQDVYGRYLYMTGTYNSFNFTTTMPEEGGLWDVNFDDEEGTYEIMNVAMGKSMQYSPDYSSFGAYPDLRGVVPTLVSASKASAPRRAPVADVPLEKQTAVYYFNGSSWSVASDAVALCEADYVAMGSSYGNLQDAQPQEFIPTYLKNKFPYAQAKTEKFVVYKYYDGSSASYRATAYVYDGSAWQLNDGVRTVTSKFIKEDGKWTMFLGLTVYSHTKVSEIVSGGTYVIAVEGIAATTLPGKAYGYLKATTVAFDESHILLPDDAASCEFVITAVDGGYTIQDNLGRYLYQTGSYNSFNFQEGDMPSDGAVWTITQQADGTMEIMNTSVGKFIQYDGSYGSFGSYADLRGTMPSIYIADPSE